MRRLFTTVLVVFVVGSAFALKKDSAYRDARRAGALARIQVHIVDDLGRDVSNAEVRVFLGMNFRPKGHSVNGMTDANGVFVVEGKTCGDEVVIDVAKQGYYPSFQRLCFAEMGKEHEVVDGKWQPFDAVHGIVLRRVRNPTAMKIGRGDFALTKHLNCWLGFDIQKHDFVHPYGVGEVSDFDVMIFWDGKWRPDYTGMGVKLRFTEPHSGYYETPADSVSTFTGPYAADAENAFRQTAMFDEQVVSPTKRMRHSFNEDNCWVVRSRCEVDETGRLVSANYSVVRKISFCGKRDGRGGLRVTGAFNPTPNDTNLEPK